MAAEKTTPVFVRVPGDIRDEAQAVAATMGLTLNNLVSMFIFAVAREHAIPQGVVDSLRKPVNLEKPKEEKEK